jgi:hypothetical protein
MVELLVVSVGVVVGTEVEMEEAVVEIWGAEDGLNLRVGTTMP